MFNHCLWPNGSLLSTFDKSAIIIELDERTECKYVDERVNIRDTRQNELS